MSLLDAATSREHAYVEFKEGRVAIADAGSRFGTFVNGSRVGKDPVGVEAGAVLRVGHTLLLLVASPDRYRSPPHRLSKDFLGLPHDVLAGPDTWQSWQAAMSAAPHPYPVLIAGESGTGKEILARLLNLARPQPSPFVALNMAAVPEGLFEAELFGCTRGAFTGAVKARPGAFREASGGTLLLDEIGDLGLGLQAKLLRVLETGTVRPIGTSGDVCVHTRVVAATNRDLEQAVSDGSFRADLYYRLCGLVLYARPLRERRDEILTAARSVLAREDPELELSAEAAEALLLRRWQGNFRELHHVLIGAAVQCRSAGCSQLEPCHLPKLASTPDRETSPPPSLCYDSLREALASTDGNATQAAALLGVSRATLYNYCTRHRLDLRVLRSELRPADAPGEN